MRKTNRRKTSGESGHNIWRSYSDMMSGLLLLFILIMAVCLMQAQKNYTEKLAEQAKQIQTQNALEASQTQVGEQKEQLSQQQSKLEEQEATLAEQASALEQLQAALEAQQLTLNEKESELNTQKTLLTQKESELEVTQKNLSASQLQLDEANNLMAAQQARIDQIIGVKADLIEALQKEFQTNNINVQIDTQTGAILLDASVLFGFNESELLDAGKSVLNVVLPVYCKVLLSDEYVDYVAEVIIDGYTDNVGDYVTNLSLSQTRAFAVTEYLLNIDEGFLNPQEASRLQSLLSTNGKSMSHPILDANGNVDADASRRVEIKFRLKDEEMLEELQKLVEEGQKNAAVAVKGEIQTANNEAAVG